MIEFNSPVGRQFGVSLANTIGNFGFFFLIRCASLKPFIPGIA
jgi:hypothetical protein